MDVKYGPWNKRV